MKRLRSRRDTPAPRRHDGDQIGVHIGDLLVNARLIAVAFVVAVALLLTRGMFEQTMQRHMLLHLPLLFAQGLLLGAATTRPSPAPAWYAWNAQGAAGLLLAGGVLMTWMIPRALDAAVEHLAIDVLKAGSLVVAGALAWHSWRMASTIVRTFTLGNTVWMSATIGMLLLDAPTRLCTTYGTSDQRGTGIALIALTIAAAVGTGILALYAPARVETAAR